MALHRFQGLVRDMKDLSDSVSCAVPGLCVVLGLLRGVAGSQGLAVILQEAVIVILLGSCPKHIDMVGPVDNRPYHFV